MNTTELDELYTQLKTDAAALAPQLVIWRRDFHMHPELGFQEVRTAGIVAEHLRNLGLEVSTGVGKTGVVALVEADDTPVDAPTVMLRFDMDALPIVEQTELPFRSQNQGVMHACGHDGHTAMLLAAASLLVKDRDFHGRVVLIFQPAEEGGGGAKSMIEDGLFRRFDCDQVFAIHNWPGLAEGTFGLNPGPIMASSNQFEVKVLGKGAHAAMPHLGVDPVLVSSHLIQAFQAVVTRTSKPVEPVVISVTQVAAGEAVNVIPDHCLLKGTVRTFSIEALDVVEEAMRHICQTLPQAFHASAEFQFDRQYPPTINHKAPTAVAELVATELVGSERVVMPVEPTMGAEDFAYMLLERPGSYIFLGNGDLTGPHREVGHGLGPCALHNPCYDFNDRLIPIGATFWRALSQQLLA